MQVLSLLELALYPGAAPFTVSVGANSTYFQPEFNLNGTVCRPVSVAREGEGVSIDFSGQVDNSTHLSLVEVPDGGGGNSYVPATVEEACTRESSKLEEVTARVILEVSCTWPDMLEGAGLGGVGELRVVGECPPGMEGEPSTKVTVREAVVVGFLSQWVKN